MLRARFSHETLEAEGVKIVHIVDRNDGALSITNDAEEVVRHLLRTFDKHRFFYTDTDGLVDELCHDGTRFTGFNPGPRPNASGRIDWHAFVKANPSPA